VTAAMRRNGIPRPADVPALATRATLPEVETPAVQRAPDPRTPARRRHDARRVRDGRMIGVDGFLYEDGERLATWDRVLP
jgi:hypothetical protein